MAAADVADEADASRLSYASRIWRVICAKM